MNLSRAAIVAVVHRLYDMWNVCEAHALLFRLLAYSLLARSRVHGWVGVCVSQAGREVEYVYELVANVNMS